MGPKTYTFWQRMLRAPDTEGASGGGGETDVGEAQASDTTPSGEGAAAEGSGEQAEAEGEEAEAEVPAEKPKSVPWAQRRIDELTKHRREAEAKAAALEQEVALLRQANDAAMSAEDKAATRTALDQAQIEQKAQELAAKKAAEESFNTACNAVYTQGKAQHNDFDDVLKQYGNLGGLTAPFISAALETSNPAGVLYALGKDLDQASEIMTLPPLKQAVAMERLAAKLAAPKPVSKAPAPVKPLGTNKAGQGTKNPDEMTMAEWKAWRDSQLKTKRG